MASPSNQEQARYRGTANHREGIAIRNEAHNLRRCSEPGNIQPRNEAQNGLVLRWERIASQREREQSENDGGAFCQG